MLIGLTETEGGAGPSVRFSAGTIVRHKRYGYRGVIVSVDPCCKACDKWYYANKTQPDRDQPWYHVLVHDSGGLSTYVAQTNLEEEKSGEPVNHPRIACYFSEFRNGAYCVRGSEQD
ncbi:MAG: heat shock protein HspQ [Opitutales bacterium]